MFFLYVLVCILGLIFGSFLTSFTYRILQGELLPKGRSYCPNCKKTIAWFDNIPLFSYFFLHGKCRNCHKKISIRYPLIEVTTASLFLGIFHGFTLCQTAFVTNPLCMLTTPFGFGSLLFLYCVSFIFFSIFIIDYEYQIIPDILSLLLFVASFLYILLTGADAFWVHMLCGFLASLFLLILHIGTKGRGMGLGDVKIALSFGILLGYPFTITWLFVSFILGSIIGIILLTFRKVQFGMHIPFGPFLIAAYFVVLFWGDTITKFIIPYLY